MHAQHSQDKDKEKDRSERPRGKMTVEEAGRLGGEARKAELGPQGYSELGKKGGEARKAELGPEGYAELGRKGGETVSQDRAHMAEIGREGGQARGRHNAERLAAQKAADETNASPRGGTPEQHAEAGRQSNKNR